jgi:hypothetical protein
MAVFVSFSYLQQFLIKRTAKRIESVAKQHFQFFWFGLERKAL